MLSFTLTALGAALACALELLEALAIVLAVSVTRRPRDAYLGAAAAGLVCLALAVVIGPVLAARVAVRPLRLIVGTALLFFGLEWGRKAVLRLAGRRSRSSSIREYEEEVARLDALELPPEGEPDWLGRTVAFKGVLLEGVEVILIVGALAARPGGAAAALTGAGIAVLLCALIAVLLHRPLARAPETELKAVVGIFLTSIGTFFCAEGLGFDWPLGDGALPLLVGWWAVVGLLLVRRVVAAEPVVA